MPPLSRRFRLERTGRPVLPLLGAMSLLLAPIAARADPGPATTVHVVQSGETLSQIALDVGADADAIAAMNGITDSNVLSTGQSLKLPVGSSGTASAATATATSATVPTAYTVVDGDTLWDIAQRFNTTTDALLQLNQLDDAGHLSLGQVLSVPASASAPARSASTDSSAQPAPSPKPALAADGSQASATGASQRGTVLVSYTVQPGETLNQIARQFGVRGDAIAQASSMDDPNRLSVGAVLKVPVAAKQHVVADGETLRDIAASEKVDLGSLIDFNQVDDPALIHVGQVVLLPVAATPVAASGATTAAPAQPAHTAAPAPPVQTAAAAPALTNPATTAPAAAAPAATNPATTASAAATLAATNPATTASTNGAPATNPAGPTNSVATNPTNAVGATPPNAAAAGSGKSGGVAAASAGASATAAAAAAAGASGAAAAAGAPPAAATSPTGAATSPTGAATSPTGATAASAHTASKPLVPVAVVAPPPGAPTDGVAGAALRFLGMPYVWGGSSPSGFDCSGFVWYVARQAGRQLSRGMFGQYNGGSHPARDDLKVGDLVFFQNTFSPGLSHNGIYIGNGQFVHAADEAAGVTISSLGTAYWSSHWFGATRLP